MKRLNRDTFSSHVVQIQQLPTWFGTTRNFTLKADRNMLKDPKRWQVGFFYSDISAALKG